MQNQHTYQQYDLIQFFGIDKEIPASHIVISVIEVYPGTKWNDTCIAENNFKTKDGWVFKKTDMLLVFIRKSGLIPRGLPRLRGLKAYRLWYSQAAGAAIKLLP